MKLVTGGKKGQKRERKFQENIGIIYLKYDTAMLPGMEFLQLKSQNIATSIFKREAVQPLCLGILFNLQ